MKSLRLVVAIIREIGNLIDYCRITLTPFSKVVLGKNVPYGLYSETFSENFQSSVAF